MNIAVCCKTGIPTAKLDFLDGIVLYAKYEAISSLPWTRALMHTGQKGFVQIFQVFLRARGTSVRSGDTSPAGIRITLAGIILG